VTEGDFSGAWNGAASDEAGVADGVMRGSKRASANEPASVFERAGDRVDARGFNGLLERHGRKNGGDALGEDGFSGPGRPGEENVVATGAGDFESALGGLLAVDFAQVN